MRTFVAERLQQIEKDGYKLSFDDIFNRGFTLWKKITGPVAGAALLIVVLVGLLLLVASPFIYGISFPDMIDLGKNNPQFFSELAEDPMFRLRSLGFNLLVGVLLAPLGGGFLRLCKDADFSGRASFGTVFYYFRMPYLLNLMVVSFLISVVSLAVNFGLQELGMIGTLLNYVVLIVIHTLTAFTVSFVIFADAGPVEAIGSSVKLASKNFFMVLGMTLVGAIIGIVGLLVCCIGMLFTVAYIYIVNYLIYRQAIGFEEMQEAEAEIQSGEIL